MAVAKDTVTGTITLTSGSTAFTTSGTNMLMRGHLPGDTILRNGLVLVIDTITGENAGTLADTCPAGAAGAGVPVRIRFQPDGSRVKAESRNLIDVLGSGNLQAEAGLSGAADKISYFNGVATKALADFKAWGRSLLGLTMAADKVPYAIDANTMALMTVTAAARTVLDDPTVGAMLTTLGAVNLNGDTMVGDLAIAKANPTLTLNKGVGSTAVTIRALRNALQRWGIQLGDATPESGSNAGSDLYVARYDDAGTLIAQALSIIRSTGLVTIGAGLVVNGGQIKFPSTQNPSTDPYTLDDYREGSTTPTVTSGSGTLTSAGCTLYYLKIGRWVFWEASIGINNNGTAAAFLILPLPFTPVAASAVYGENDANANGLSGRTSGASALIFLYNGSYPVVTGNVIEVGGKFPTAA